MAKKRSLWCLFSLVLFNCTQSVDQDRLEQLLARMADAPETPIPPAQGEQKDNRSSAVSLTAGQTSVVGGIPRSVNAGYCGDGIMNGDLEQCDKGAIPKTACSGYGGTAGQVSCTPECLLDISNCITPAVDEVFGGYTENCRCACAQDNCTGGCSPLTESGTSTGISSCLFDCNNQCYCNCEERIEATIERCRLECTCYVDTTSFPDCYCRISDCYIVAGNRKNIASTAIKVLGNR